MRRILAALFLALLAAALVVGPGTPQPATATPDRAPRTSPAAPARAEAGTRQVVVRPVTTEGRPAPGWPVVRQRGAASCTGAARGAVDPGIVTCFPTVYGLAACWRSQRHTALCVRSLFEHQLVRVRYQGRFPRAVAPAQAAPNDLTLGGGRACRIRTGGAWGSPPGHPRWVGYYSCDDGAVYGPARPADGIDRSEPAWTVHVVEGPRARVTVRAVRAAFYVGTAAAA